MKAFKDGNNAADVMERFVVGSALAVAVHTFTKEPLDGVKDDRIAQTQKIFADISDHGMSYIWEAQVVYLAVLQYPLLAFGILSRYRIYRHWKEMLAVMRENEDIYGATLEKMSWGNPIYKNFITPFRLAVGETSEN